MTGILSIKQAETMYPLYKEFVSKYKISDREYEELLKRKQEMKKKGPSNARAHYTTSNPPNKKHKFQEESLLEFLKKFGGAPLN